MSANNENHKYLRDLTTEFRSSNNPATFEEILKIVDKLLLYVIYGARRSKPYLRKVGLQDLYHTAVLGLHQALGTVKDDEPGSKIIYRIVRYVQNEIGKDNKHNRTNKVSFPFSIADISFQVNLHSFDMAHSGKFISQIEKLLIASDSSVCRSLEGEFTRDRFAKLIEEGIITSQEFEMLCMHYVYGMSFTDIAGQMDSTVSTISRKIEKVLNRLRFEFRRRNWEGIEIK